MVRKRAESGVDQRRGPCGRGGVGWEGVGRFSVGPKSKGPFTREEREKTVVAVGGTGRPTDRRRRSNESE